MSTEKLNVKVGMPNYAGESRIPNKRKVNLKDVIAWLHTKNYAADVLEELVKKANEMTDGTYYQFAKNVRGYIAAFQKRKNKKTQKGNDIESGNAASGNSE
jgi:hypothetical protein